MAKATSYESIPFDKEALVQRWAKDPTSLRPCDYAEGAREWEGYRYLGDHVCPTPRWAAGHVELWADHNDPREKEWWPEWYLVPEDDEEILALVSISFCPACGTDLNALLQDVAP